jgi:SAM-dependent methyltransferase
MSGPAIAHGGDSPVSPWVARWAHLVPEGGTLLDVACGGGRHLRFFAPRGCRVTGVDRDAEALAPLGALGEIVMADIENGPWPLPEREFDAVLVTNYLWRPLWPQLLAAVRPGGVLIYETFARGNEAYGRPKNPDFLLARGELLQACAGWHVIAFEDVFVESPPRCVQRIAARRPSPAAPLESAPGALGTHG